MNTMKKISLLVVFCIAMLSPSDAYSQLRFGVRGGVDVADNSLNNDIFKVENRVGYQLGAALDVKVPIIGLGVETGAQFGHKNYKNESSLKIGDSDVKMKNLNYVHIPVYLKQTFSVFGIAGIYVKGGMYANFKVNGGSVEIAGTDYDSKRMQKGLGAGAGVVLLQHLELGMNYQHRLDDPYSSADFGNKFNLDAFNKVGRNTWTVTLAYYL